MRRSDNTSGEGPVGRGSTYGANQHRVQVCWRLCKPETQQLLQSKDEKTMRSTKMIRKAMHRVSFITSVGGSRDQYRKYLTFCYVSEHLSS